jgi:hypothetical protein
LGSSSCTFTVTVNDAQAPVTPTLADVNVGECSGTPPAPTTTDNCAGTVTGTTLTVFPITAQGTTVVTWTFDDGNGNSTTADQNVIVDDVTAPTTPTLADVNVGECSGTPTAPTTTDNCAGTVTGTTLTVFPITAQGTTEVTWTFNDGNGNSTTANQNVIVDDITAPATPTLADVNVGECSGTPTAPTTTDNCAGTVTGTTLTVFPITAQGTTVVTWTFDDGNGNSTTANQNVIVDDVTAPTTPTLADVNVGECSGTPTAPTTTDNCVTTVTGTTVTVFPITAQGTTVVTWTFNDGNGNSTTANQNVIVDDVTAPATPTLADVNVGECSGTPTAPTTTDNCVTTVTGTTSTLFPITAQGTTEVTWTFNDGNGNSTTANQNVIVDDVTAPTTPTLADVNVGECSGTPTAPTTTDNCVTTVTGTTLTVFPITAQGTTVVTWTFNDGNGNSTTANQNVIVKDITAPTIVCPANIVLSACQATATWTKPIGSDNCSVTVDQTNGPVSGSTFDNDTTTTITYTATDAGGNKTSCSFTVTRDKKLSATISTNNSTLYFGYSGDQRATITATPSGGTAPYIIKIMMQNGATTAIAPAAQRVNGKLICGFINSAGNEAWTPGLNTNTNVGVSTGITCATATDNTSSTSNPTSGIYSVDVTLMADARFIAIVTDAKGCSYTIPYELAAKVDAEDARCFAGNSGNAKVTVCHRTGSTKNPCVTLCVDQSAVQEHINHGDYVGKCNTTCAAPVANAKQIAAKEVEEIPFKVTAYPNPSRSQFTLLVEGGHNEKVEVLVYDMMARLIKRIEKTDGQPILFGEELPTGEYLTIVKQGENMKAVNLLKQ